MPQTFWDHLEELRSTLIGIVAVSLITSVVAFSFKEILFDIILAPSRNDFITHRLLNAEDFSINLMNVGLTEQFMVHVKAAMCAGILVASPYIIYMLFRFVSPALYDNERRYGIGIAGGGYLMFLVGATTNYFLVFPLTVRFLGTYQVSEVVTNMLTLDSYMDTLMMLTLTMGLVFELPVVCWLLGKMGLINAQMLSHYRRHAFVIILIIAAIITPTGDPFTLFAVSLPIWLLYELSIRLI
ncbi:MAG: twin-arginine translocase subunit TatC [Bacteroidaceae bacterium]|nr:twin-arginine translocase subunit TatC [Bacteroidaceae bacterium]